MSIHINTVIRDISSTRHRNPAGPTSGGSLAQASTSHRQINQARNPEMKLGNNNLSLEPSTMKISPIDNSRAIVALRGEGNSYTISMSIQSSLCVC